MSTPAENPSRRVINMHAGRHCFFACSDYRYRIPYHIVGYVVKHASPNGGGNVSYPLDLRH